MWLSLLFAGNRAPAQPANMEEKVESAVTERLGGTDTAVLPDVELEVNKEPGAVPADRKVYFFAKRLMDLVLSVMALAVLIVPMGIVALLIKLDSPGPAFYIHKRIGKNGKPLPLLKYRSMHVNADQMIKEFTPEQKAEWEANFKLEHDPRITRMGKFLRRSSLDELPQLINIIKGELSIVGPRPVVKDELEKYGENKARFLSVTPGLTGYWQAYARSTCTYEKRMEMELHYVENANFWWDIKIMFATVGRVLRGTGAK